MNLCENGTLLFTIMFLKVQLMKQLAVLIARNSSAVEIFKQKTSKIIVENCNIFLLSTNLYADE